MTAIPTTGRELFDLAYTTMAISPESFINDTTERGDYEIQMYNVAALEFFNRIKGSSSRTNNMIVEHHDLLSIDEMQLAADPDSDADLITLGFTALRVSDVEQIVSVFAKHRTDGQSCKLQYISPLNLQVPISEALKGTGIASENYSNVYTTIENKLYVFPAPEKTVSGGLTIYVRRGYVQIDSIEDASPQIPAEYAYVLINLLCEKIADRNREFVVGQRYRAAYERDAIEAVSNLSERSAEKQKSYVGSRGFYR